MTPQKIISRTIHIKSSSAHERLDQALTKLMPEYSRSQIQKWIEAGDIQINASQTKSNYRVLGGETVTVNTVILDQSWEAEAIPLSIVYEDEDLMIIDKHIGMVVHPGAGHKDHTLLNALIHHAPQLKILPRAGILHRLDKNTSGLLIIAKNHLALKKLSHQLKKHHIIREYQAIVYGTLISGRTIDAPIGRHPRERKRMSIVDTGKSAITHFRVVEKYRSHTRVKVKLETGRTHQIRVHMASIHHPIIGDKIYGGALRLSKNMSADLIMLLRHFKRQALHAYALTFTHPITDKQCHFEIELPADMRELIHLLREDMKRHTP